MKSNYVNFFLSCLLITSCTVSHIGNYYGSNGRDTIQLKLGENGRYKCFVNHHILGKGSFEGSYSVNEQKKVVTLDLPSNKSQIDCSIKKAQTESFSEVLVIEDGRPLIGANVEINDSLSFLTDKEGKLITEAIEISRIAVWFPGIIQDTFICNIPQTLKKDTPIQVIVELPLQGTQAITMIENKWKWKNRKLLSAEQKKNAFLLHKMK